MSILWFNERNKDLIATIATNNITLNKPACDCIPDAYNVMLGISTEEKKVFIKAINKEHAIRGDIPESQLYTITLRTSYARISNKEFIKEIKKRFNIDFISPKKYIMCYDEGEHTLVVDLDREVIE